jgi:hypothetical protein
LPETGFEPWLGSVASSLGALGGLGDLF